MAKEEKKEKREEVYVRFGPLLLEALFDELDNRIRAIENSLNIPIKDKQSTLEQVLTKEKQAKKFKWMK